MSKESQQLFRVLAEGWAADQNLDRTVRQSVPASLYRMYLDDDFGDEIWLWGTSDSNRQYWKQLETGDVLLFYTAGERFTIAAQVRKCLQSGAFAADAWTPPFGGTSTKRRKATGWEFLIVLDEPVEINLPPDELADYLDYTSGAPRRFQRVKEERLSQIRSEYSSVWEFALQYRVTEPSDTEGTYDGPSMSGVISRQLAADHPVLLRGPRKSGQLSRARAVAGDAHLRVDNSISAAENRIDVLSLDSSDTYESLIERPAEQSANGIIDGRFKRICEEVRGGNPSQDRGHVVVLPDIGDIDLRSMFGEVMTLFDDSNNSVQLRYSHEEFSIPDNLSIIATADEKAHHSDEQLHEYFRVIELNPQYGTLFQSLSIAEETENAPTEDTWPPEFDIQQRIKDVDEPIATALSSIHLLWKLNREVLAADTDGARLGHEYLAGELGSRTTIRDAWVVELLPIIRRHPVLARLLTPELPVINSDGSLDATASFEEVSETVSMLLEELDE